VPIATGAVRLLGAETAFDANAFDIDDAYVGSGYGIATPGGLEAIEMLARTEAIILEPVYSGKAMAGLIDHIRQGRYTSRDAVVFIATGGGPSLFARAAEISGAIGKD
jgi:1-aminocyclopropane-1-carboxylate deaminase/D-cysteine desulfhydrase-like pyridoxal-dependent ACC family enzyme